MLKTIIVDSISKPGEGVEKGEFSMPKIAPPRQDEHSHCWWKAEISTAYELQVD